MSNFTCYMSHNIGISKLLQPESARVIKSQPEIARVSQSQPESARVGQSFWYLDFLGLLAGPKRFFVENLITIYSLTAKLSNEKYYHGNILEQVTKVTQTKTKYDQFKTQYASRLLQPICYTNTISGEEIPNFIKNTLKINWKHTKQTLKFILSLNSWNFYTSKKCKKSNLFLQNTLILEQNIYTSPKKL